MAVSSVVTEGYGPGASIALIVTAGYAIGEQSSPTPEPVAPGAFVPVIVEERSFLGHITSHLSLVRFYGTVSAPFIDVIHPGDPDARFGLPATAKHREAYAPAWAIFLASGNGTVDQTEAMSYRFVGEPAARQALGLPAEPFLHNRPMIGD
jgi:hypothetical protein